MRPENILQSFQRLASVAERLDNISANQSKFEKEIVLRVDRCESHIADMRERLARLESFRNADRAEMQAELARFKVEVERAEMKLTNLLPPPAKNDS